MAARIHSATAYSDHMEVVPTTFVQVSATKRINNPFENHPDK